MNKPKKNPSTLYLYGLKAAPLTSAHCRIIDDLLKIVEESDTGDKLLVSIAPVITKEFGDVSEYAFALVGKYIERRILEMRAKRAVISTDTLDGTVCILQQRGYGSYWKWVSGQKFGVSCDKKVLVVGEDEYTALTVSHSWMDNDDILDNCELKMYPRPEESVSSTKLRELLFRDPELPYFYVKDWIYRTVFDDIKKMGAFGQNPPNSKAEENRFLSLYDASKFERPSVTVDNIMWRNVDGIPEIYLIRRGGHPYKGYWALPGGFLDVCNDVSLKAAAERELREETGTTEGSACTRDDWMRQFKAYGDIGVDPRTRVVDVVFSSKVNKEFQPLWGDDAVGGHWFRIDELPALAFNHEQIILEWSGMLI